MATKINVGDYVPGIYSCAKLHYDTIRGFCLTYAKLPTECSLLVFRFPTRYPKAAAPILMLSASKDIILRKNVPLVVPTTKFYILTPFPPKRKFSVDFQRDKISARNGL